MARILGIDFGTRRTGIAVTDPLQIIVNPLTVLPTSEVITFLVDYVRKEQVERIVCGMPAESYPDTRKALGSFVQSLTKALPAVPLVFQDEDMSSIRAADVILKSGIRKMQRRDKGLVDKISAVLILQEYLGHLNDAYQP